MLIKGSEAGKLAGKEGGRRQALTPVPKHVNLCVCGEGSPSHHPYLASGRSFMLLIKLKENDTQPMPILFFHGCNIAHL